MKEQEEKYQRVGTTLYKIVRRPLMSGDFIEERRPWNYETLRQDHSKDYISQIEKYDGFCSVPDHINYKRSIGKFLNQYEPINYQPAEGNCNKIIDWVRKILPLKKENSQILDELKEEIPHFLDFLQHREFSTKCESRMWFRHDLLVTDALRKIIQYNRGKVEIEMLNLISEIMQIKELEMYSFCVNDILDMLTRISMKTETTQIRRILQDKWGLSPEDTTRYTAYIFGNNDIIEAKKTARIYRISRKQIDELVLHC